MGKFTIDNTSYSNYWNPKFIREDDVPEAFWNDAIKVLDKIIESGIKLTNADGDKIFESGEDIIDDTVCCDYDYPFFTFNGYGDDACEPFTLAFEGSWNTCRTDGKPYDVAVKCMLLLANKYDLLRTDLEEDAWYFDGDSEVQNDENYTQAQAILMSMNMI